MTEGWAPEEQVLLSQAPTTTPPLVKAPSSPPIPHLDNSFQFWIWGTYLVFIGTFLNLFPMHVTPFHLFEA